MKKTHFLFAVLTLIITACSGQPSSISKKEMYQCPMKCEGDKTYNKPGKCPECKMDLEKINENKSEEINKSNVKNIGAMSNVMHKGELFGTISLDTISNKKHLYGLGPVQYLKGEILIIDGKAYKSTVTTSTTMKIEETYQVKAPFFVYANISNWKEISLPDSIQSIPQLESYLDSITKNEQRPFAFKISAVVNNAEIHIVNLPDGTKVHSPEDARKNQVTYSLSNEQADMIGFFSTQHKGIFTHHDSFVHIHLITADKTKMGHLEKVSFKKGTAKLYLPQ